MVGLPVARMTFAALLRARRERPHRRSAAEQRDELTPFQLIELHSFPTSQGRFAGYRIGRDQSAGIGALAKASPSSAMLTPATFACRAARPMIGLSRLCGPPVWGGLSL
jgi:hypothetical protein